MKAIPASQVKAGMLAAFRAENNGKFSDCDYHLVTRIEHVTDAVGSKTYTSLIMHSDAGRSAKYSLEHNKVCVREPRVSQLHLFSI